MNNRPACRAGLRYETTSLRALGIPEDTSIEVHQAHLEGCDTLEEAVHAYRTAFHLSDGACVRITSTRGRTVIGNGGDGIRLVRMPGSHRLLSDEMVVHR